MRKTTSSNKALLSSTSISRVARHMMYAMAGVMVATTSAHALPVVGATELPTGPTLVSGTGTYTIDAATNTATANQTSNRVLVDWNTFNIGENAHVIFNQPNAQSIAVNRVTSGDPSQILGSLKANGQIILLNSNGVIFGAHSQVDVGGLLASTGKLVNDNDFINGIDGKINLTGINANNAKVSIADGAKITVAQGGLAAFVAPQFINNGVIEANLGKIAIAGGADKATVDLYGDDLVEMTLDANATRAVLENNGTLRANGGKIAMTVKAAQAVVDSTINMNGVAQANSFSTKDGVITLDATNADIKVASTGKINANTRGGKVTVKSNRTVTVDAGGEINTNSGVGVTTGTTSIAGDNGVAIAGSVSSNRGDVTINSSNGAATATGVITANKLSATTMGALTVSNAANQIKTLGNVTASSVALTNATNLDVVGNVATAAGAITINETGDLAISTGSINAAGGNVSLTQSGKFSSTVANTVRTLGTGMIALVQNVGGVIQNAIEAISNTGTGTNTVSVGAGTYNESVTVAKSVNLVGAANATSIIKETGAPTDMHKFGFLVQANNVTIDGFRIIGDGNITTDDAGIFSFNSNNSTFKNNVIKDQTYGIFAIGDATVTSGTISGNKISGADGDGVIAYGGTNINVKDNNISNASGGTANGIYIWLSNNAVVENNNTDVNGYGILVESSNGVMVGGATAAQGNVVKNGLSDGIKISSSNGVTVDHNKVSNIARVGIYADHNDSLTIKNNTVDQTTAAIGSPYGGITNDWGSNVTIDSNTISNSGHGVMMYDTTGTNAVTNNIINDVTTNGVNVQSVSNLSIDGNKIGQTGSIGSDAIHLSGTAAASISSNVIAQGNNGIFFDGSSSATTVNANKFTNAGQYINNQNSAFTLNLVGAGNQFNGVTLAAITDFFALEDKMTHAIDNSAFGKIITKANNWFVTMASGSIQRGLNVAAAGNTVNVGAGTFNETLNVTKAVTLKGAQAGVAGDDTSRGTGETIVQNSDAVFAAINVAANNVTIDGLTISNTTGDAVDTYDADSFTFRNNIMKDSAFGLYADGSGASTAGVIKNNLVSNIDGHGIYMQNNQYYDVLNNTITDVLFGITTANFFNASQSGNAATFNNNTITAHSVGIRNNLSYGAQSGFVISNNTIKAITDLSDTRRWGGIEAISQQGGVATIFSGNKVDGSGAAGRQSAGYELTNMTNANRATIDGGVVKNTDVGVWATDGSFYTGAVSDLLVTNVDFKNIAQAGILAEDTIDANNIAGIDVNNTTTKITIGAGNTFTNTPYDLIISGAATVALDAGFDGVSNTLVEAAGNAHYVGSPYYAATPTALTTANASITNGASATVTGGTVTVDAGTFNEIVSINKGVTLKGAQYGVNGTDASRGTGETIIQASDAVLAALNVAANGVTIDGFTISNTTGDAVDTLNADSFAFRNNIMKDSAFGMYADGTGASTAGVVENNLVSGIDGHGIYMQNNQYYDVLNNTITDVNFGITTANFYAASQSGNPATIDGNIITSHWVGIRNNLSNGAQSGFVISNNNISAMTDLTDTRRWAGVEVISQNGGVGTVFLNNTIDGSGAAGRQSAGYELTNLGNPNRATIDGGSVSNVDVGVWATDGSFYTGGVADLLIKNVAFNNIAEEGILAEDTTAVGSTPNANFDVNSTTTKITIGAGNTFTNTPYDLAIAGAATVALDTGFDGVANTHVMAAGNANYTEQPYYATTVPTVLTTTNASITKGAAATATGGTVSVDAGTFNETVSIAKSVTLQGAQAGVAGTDASRGTGETIIQASDAVNAALTVTGTNVTIDGFTISNTTGDAVDTLDADGFAFRNNIMKDSAFGMYADGTGASAAGVVENNLVSGIDGHGIYLRANQYFTVQNNTLTDVNFGITTEGFYNAAQSSALTLIDNNTIAAHSVGIRNNLSDSLQSGFQISNNTITAITDPSDTRRWSGIEVISQNGGVGTVFLNNTIDGFAVTGRTSAGYELTNMGNANRATIDGGSVSNVDVGVWATDGSFYTGGIADLLIKNVAFSDIAEEAILAEDTMAVGSTPNVNFDVNNTTTKITIGAGNTFTNTPYDLAIAGAATVALDTGFDGVANTHVKAAGNAHYADQPYYATTTPTVLTTANASINTGIDATATNGNVTIDAGTFNEAVNIDKTVAFTIAPLFGTIVDGTGLASNGITISANDINLNGWLVQNSEADGIAVASGVSGADITGNHVNTTTGAGISAIDASGLTIDQNVISDAGTDGIAIATSNGAVLTFNDINTAGGNGLSIDHSVGVQANDNTIKNAGQDGFVATFARNLTALRNTVRAITTGNGMVISHSNNADVEGNTIRNVGGNAIQLSDSRSVSINDNIINNAGADGINVSTLTGNSEIRRNVINNVDNDGIHAQGANRLVIANNNIGLHNNSVIGNVGIYADQITNGRFANNKIANTVSDGMSINDMQTATVINNTITGAGGNGIGFDNVDLATIDNNTVNDNDQFGLFFTNVNGSMVLTNNTINSLVNGTGARFEGGSIDLSGDTNAFNGGTNGLEFDGSTVSLVGNTFGETEFSGQSDYYIALSNGALFGPATTPAILDARQVNFDGFIPGSYTISFRDYVALNAKLYEFNDLQTLGSIFFTYPGLDINDILPQLRVALSKSSGRASITILGLPYASFNLANITTNIGGRSFNTNIFNLKTAEGGSRPTNIASSTNGSLPFDPQALNQIATSSGGATNSSNSPAELNNIETAAGGSATAGCWGQVYSHFNASSAPVTYNLDGSPSAMISDNASASCGN